MIKNPAKATYMKFDTMANMMAMDAPSAEPKKESRGLLKRLMSKENKKEGTKKQEPIEIAMDYFIAIREQRNALKGKE
tara:strand:- start:125 stop:358 length:234 start_codon:yes stop_codon:yes gene_type:complete